MRRKYYTATIPLGRIHSIKAGIIVKPALNRVYATDRNSLIVVKRGHFFFLPDKGAYYSAYSAHLLFKFHWDIIMCVKILDGQVAETCEEV